ncbi:oligosaccharide flippase family protein [Amycolatopsis dendrobii]|uniref:Oligosaccharide flippase family protein n=1 Tax=Amycolatopsis dendrobii TaxID=2760662 RepID=A0A7W3ZE11_9PSEU|nr:oligosaccharide flippase family protein [Amycolatopsis dendrobii]MBB1158010.1 oligosaccharide flippase family protein [Amycolatopsis dendrobii]
MTALAAPSFAARLKSDPLVRNSFFLMATTALGAGSGFVFWIVVARLYPPAAVGWASSLLSAVTLLSYFSGLGLSSSLVRYLPTTPSRAAHVSSALTSVAVTGTVLGAGFALVAPFVSPGLSFLSESVPEVVLFALLAMAVAQNLLTDSVFVALRAAKYNMLLNGVLMSAVKIALPVVFAGAGAIGIFLSSTVASAVAAAASILVIRQRLRIPVRPRVHPATLRSTLAYSLGNYASSCLNLLPLLVIPLLVLRSLGPEASAAYFVAFQIANFVNAVPFAVGEALFAEGSHEQEDLRQLAKRSALLILAIVLPAVSVTVALAKPVLALFGASYAADARNCLVVLAVSAFAVAFNTWSGFLLKVTRQLPAMNLSNLVYAGVTVGLAALGAQHDLVWIAAAWGVGNLASGLVAVVALAPRGLSSGGKGGSDEDRAHRQRRLRSRRRGA